jgi:predicted signal transduction protein with EAL and GGDEF domain
VSRSAGAGLDSRPGSPLGSRLGETSFLDALRRCIDERRPSGRSLPVLLIETGIIVGIDDVWGVQLGNAVRDRVCAALRSEVLRPDDPLSEIGRGKLVFALTAVDDPAIVQLAAEKSLRVLSTPFLLGEDEIYARPAIGIAMWPAHGDDAETLLQHAGTASLIARSDPSHITFYAKDQIVSGATQFLYENRLRSAVAEEHLDLWFQPQYDLHLGNVMGAESLLRSRDPRMGLVNAVDVYGAAESAGLAIQLVSSVLNRALRNCSEFRYSAGLNLQIGVNLPARLLFHSELPEIIERALGTWSLRAGRLVLEISETSLLQNDSAARAMLGKLDELGVRLAIDDPRLPLSSLYWLAALPFKAIKIDVSGAADLGTAQQSLRITQSLVELGHHLKLDVFAVGAADDQAEARLKEIGCDYAQSDRKAPPLEAAEFVKRYALT